MTLWQCVRLGCLVIGGVALVASASTADAQSRDWSGKNQIAQSTDGRKSSGSSDRNRDETRAPNRNNDRDEKKRRRTRDRKPGDIEWIIGTVQRLPPWPDRPRRPKRPQAAKDSEPPRLRPPAAKRPSKKGRAVAAAPIGTLRGEIRQREVIVALAGSSAASLANELGRALGLRAETSYVSPLLGLRLVRLTIPDNRSVAEVLASLSRYPDVISVQPSYVYRASQGAAGALAVPQYAPEKLRLNEAHQVARGQRVRIAVIDTGVDEDHPELKGAISDTFDALGDGQSDPESHGTAIAGIVASRDALTGVAPAASVISARAFSSQGSGAAQSTSITLLKSIDWAYTSGARVVNMSFAGPEDPLLLKAIDAGTAKGMIFVAAAGNNGPKAPPAYPAAFSNVIAVTASDSADGLYTAANRGPYISVAAPGVDIIAPGLEGRYEMSSGTSLAAAHVSGIVALLLELRPDLNPKAVRETLRKSARKPDADHNAKDFGAGIVDAAAAVGANLQ